MGSGTRSARGSVAFMRPPLLEFPSSQIDALDAAHIGDVLERIPFEHQQVGDLAPGQCAEFLVDAQGLRRTLRERLDHLHRRETGLHHQVHLPVLEKSLDEKAVGGAAAVGPEGEANTGVGQLLDGTMNLPVRSCPTPVFASPSGPDRKSTRLNSSHTVISYAVFCLKKKKKKH